MVARSSVEQVGEGWGRRAATQRGKGGVTEGGEFVLASRVCVQWEDTTRMGCTQETALHSLRNESSGFTSTTALEKIPDKAAGAATHTRPREGEPQL